ncbi:MAG: hypothetical protein HY645_02765 [Acidobacteria bacterium]|nr:hypothetical protein [Acidobacteriota bacterium]
MIPAYSPQTRGRCERFFGTWQGRLPQELRQRGIESLNPANAFLRDHWIPYHNRHFRVPAPDQGTAFVPYAGAALPKIFSHQEERIVKNDNTVTFGSLTLQIAPQKFRFSMARCRALVCRHLDETLSLYCGPHLLGCYRAQGEPLSVQPQQSKNKAA